MKRFKMLAARSRYFVAAAWYGAALSVGLVLPSKVLALSDVAYSGSDVTGLVESTIALPGLTVSSSDPTVPVNLSVDSGILSMSTTTGLTFTSATTGSQLAFNGSVADVNAALATLSYRTVTPGAVTFSMSLTEGGEVFFPGNGHLYEIVDNGGSINANDARTAAAALTKGGANGYLATITSEEENDYISARMTGDGWFGASDAGTEGDWQWATGPETGTSFWSGLSDGSPVGGLFSDWAPGEPNDSGDEDCGQFYSTGNWNDLSCTASGLDFYVVEYGAPGDLPDIPAVDFQITANLPTPQVIDIDNCLELIDVGDNGTADRYDTLRLTTDIDCTGETLEPMFDDVDPDFGPLGFRGTLDGQSNSLTNIDIDEVGNSNIGLFGHTNLATIRDLTLSGTVVGNDCTGALAGTASNTTIDNVASSVDVTGGLGVGGLVGCYDATVGLQEFFGSQVSGDVDGQDRAGGVVGHVDVIDDAELSLTDNAYAGEATASSFDVGGIAGRVDTEDSGSIAIVDNSSAGVNSPATIGSIGGIVGSMEADDTSAIDFSDNTVTGDVSGGDSVGSHIGYAEADDDAAITVHDSHATNDVTATGSSAGGLVGEIEGVTVSQSSATGAVTSDDSDVGGLFGAAYSSEIAESFATGNVTTTGNLVGGLVGRNSNTTISQSFATGNISGSSRVGGLTGATGGLISNSYARGTVAGDDNVGGLSGRCGGDIEFSYATGGVTGTSDVGGLVGYEDGCDVNSSFWDADTTGQTDSAVGTTKTTTLMKTKTTFTDTATSDGLDEAWDFEDVWGIVLSVNDGYPCLMWQNEDCTGMDDDGDGIPSEIENAAPNGGDANDDGTPDAEQGNVASLVNGITDEYTTVALPSACELSSATVETEASQSATDAGFDYQGGLVGFSADCGTPGFAATVEVYQFGLNVSGLVLRKYHPTTHAYFNVSNAQLEQVTIGGQTAARATYEIVDGETLDTDDTANGIIVDPVGLAQSVVGVPSTGAGGLAR